jgi:hypothetical protein
MTKNSLFFSSSLSLPNGSARALFKLCAGKSFLGLHNSNPSARARATVDTCARAPNNNGIVEKKPLL